MEIILAIVVVGAVIFFGALISAGNERQRKAIDDLREQTVLWAVQDLQIKRKQLAQEARVDDPLGWLNKIAARACGEELSLQVGETFDRPRALVCSSASDSRRVIFTPLSLKDIRQLQHMKSARLSQYAESNPLFGLPRKLSVYTISVLNGGMLFDLELALVWKGLTGQETEGLQTIHMIMHS